jgi:type I restriction enzyme S subunit
MNVMQRIASGTSQKNLSPNQVCDFTFAVPNKNLLDLFNLKLNGFIDAIVNNLSQNQELTSLRDFLLPLLMNGQVTFKS